MTREVLSEGPMSHRRHRNRQTITKDRIKELHFMEVTKRVLFRVLHKQVKRSM